MQKRSAGFVAAFVLAVGALILFVGGGARFAIGLTLKSIQAELATGRGLIGLAVALFQVVSALAMFWSGRLADRMSPALVLSLGVAVSAIGIGAMCLVSAPWHILVLYGFVFAIGNGIASVIPVAVLVTRYFPERPGLANALALAGLGLGQLVMMGTLALVLGDIGWRAVFAWLGLAHVLILPFVIVVLGRVARRSAQAAQSRAVTAPVEGMTIREAARTRRFWLLLAVFALCGFEDFFVSTHVVAFAQDRGADIVFAGNLLAVMGAAAIVGVLVSGAVSDRAGPVAATFVCFALRALIFAAVLLDQTVATVAAFAVLFGLTFLMTAPLVVIFVRDAFGARHLGALTGFITMVHHIFGGLGALVGAWIFDVEGAYQSVLWLMLASSVAGALLSLALRRSGRRAHAQA